MAKRKKGKRKTRTIKLTLVDVVDFDSINLIATGAHVPQLIVDSFDGQGGYIFFIKNPTELVRRSADNIRDPEIMKQVALQSGGIRIVKAVMSARQKAIMKKYLKKVPLLGITGGV